MKKILIIVLIASFPLLAEHPIDISLVPKIPGQYALKVSVPEGYAIQIDAPNRLLLSGQGVKIIKADLKFDGPVHPKKKEYFAQVNEMPLSLQGRGSINVNARIFYCNLDKGICISGKVQRTVSVR